MALGQRTLGVALLAAVIPIESQAASAPGTFPLNCGLVGQIEGIGRTRDHTMTVTLLITNPSKNIAHLLLVGRPIATDTTGAEFRIVRVAGIAWCPIQSSDPVTSCIGLQQQVDTPPSLQSYDELDPGNGSARLIFTMSSDGASSGPTASLAATLLCRLVSSPAHDANMTDQQKREQITTISVSSPFVPVRQQ